MELKAFGDAIRIKQVLLNLASNASKFTKKGVIEFDCGLVNPETQLLVEFPPRFIHKTYYVMVRDTGMGIDPKDQKIIFDAFKQVDSSESRIHGTGLGLTISKSLIELHHTHILVHSRLNEGTALYFFVPVSREAFESLGTGL